MRLQRTHRICVAGKHKDRGFCPFKHVMQSHPQPKDVGGLPLFVTPPEIAWKTLAAVNPIQNQTNTSIHRYDYTLLVISKPQTPSYQDKILSYHAARKLVCVKLRRPMPFCAILLHNKNCVTRRYEGDFCYKSLLTDCVAKTLLTPRQDLCSRIFHFPSCARNR